MCSANLGFWQDKAEPGKGNQGHAGEKIVCAKTKALQVSIGQCCLGHPPAAGRGR